MNYKKSMNGLFLTTSHLMWKKNKYLFFHKPSKKDDIPLVLPKLNINNHKIDRNESIRFLSVLLDENLSWKTHIKYIKKYRYRSISKSIGILIKARPFLNKKSLLSLYYLYIHRYINYGRHLQNKLEKNK